MRASSSASRGRSYGKRDDPADALDIVRRKILSRAKILDLAGDPARQLVRIEQTDGIDAADAVACRIPKARKSESVGTDCADSGYHHPTMVYLCFHSVRRLEFGCVIMLDINNSKARESTIVNQPCCALFLRLAVRHHQDNGKSCSPTREQRRFGFLR